MEIVRIDDQRVRHLERMGSRRLLGHRARLRSDTTRGRRVATEIREPTTETHPLDEDRDPANAAAVRGFAAEVAAQYGGDLTRMRRARGYSNATWVGDGIAVRITHRPVDMAAEVALARALPNEVGHPRILGWARSRVATGS